MSEPKAMTLRQWFAGQALVGILASDRRDSAGNFTMPLTTDRFNAGIAERAWKIADAMLEAEAGSPASPARKPPTRASRLPDTGLRLSPSGKLPGPRR